MGKIKNLVKHKSMCLLLGIVSLNLAIHVAHAQDQGTTSYMKVDITELFASILTRMQAAKPVIESRHSDLLNERYDLSDRPARGVMMERNKPLQEGVRVKLPEGMTWDKLADFWFGHSFLSVSASRF